MGCDELSPKRVRSSLRFLSTLSGSEEELPPMKRAAPAAIAITAATRAPMKILKRDCRRCTSRAISPADCGVAWPGLRPGMRTTCPQEGQVTSCPGVVPGMKKFQPQLQLSESLAMDRSLSPKVPCWVQVYLTVGRFGAAGNQEKEPAYRGFRR